MPLSKPPMAKGVLANLRYVMPFSAETWVSLNLGIPTDFFDLELNGVLRSKKNFEKSSLSLVVSQNS